MDFNAVHLFEIKSSPLLTTAISAAKQANIVEQNMVFLSCLAAYRPSRIKTPAAIASMARIIPMDGIGTLTTCVSPVTMSQIPSNSIPRFLLPIPSMLIPPRTLIFFQIGPTITVF